MKLWKKIKKYFEYGYTKIKILFAQKKYQSGKIHLKYLLDRFKNCDSLIVVFSACTRAGIKARYNYVRTLKGVHANKLFILDDFASDKRGCYYLGQYPDYDVEKAVKELIAKVYDRIHASKVLFCGSSKGGWASLNFALDMDQNNKVVICGAPQYFLGKYLENFNSTFAFIKGECDANEVISDLDRHLRQKVLNAEHLPKVYLHYSINDHTYHEHISALLDDLHDRHCELCEDIKDYENHFDVSLYFPDFLLNAVRRETEI